MEVSKFARERFENGERDETQVTDTYIKQALASDDPYTALYPAVADQVSEVFRRQRKAMERAVGSWDQPTPAVHMSDESQNAHGGRAAFPESIDTTSAKWSTAQETETSPGVHATNGSQILDGPGGLTAFDRRIMLRNEEVFILGRGKIPWRQVTIPDIDATVAHYRMIVAGVEEKIQFLESAKTLMIRHGVSVLGDVPLEDVSEIIADAA